jgi:hypothetical protein
MYSLVKSPTEGWICKWDDPLGTGGNFRGKLTTSCNDGDTLLGGDPPMCKKGGGGSSSAQTGSSGTNVSKDDRCENSPENTWVERLKKCVPNSTCADKGGFYVGTGEYLCAKDADIDGDGKENDKDDDIDGDGIPNDQDDDVDGDGIPNDRDDDIDGDGIPNDQDNDMDGDGINNADDDDIDGDGIKNDDDPTPMGTGTDYYDLLALKASQQQYLGDVFHKDPTHDAKPKEEGFSLPIPLLVMVGLGGAFLIYNSRKK